IQPALNETVLRAMDIVGCESNFVLHAASDWLSKKKPEPFDELHVAVQRLCLYLQLRSHNFPADFNLIEQLRLDANRPVAINSKISVRRDLSGIVRAEEKKSASF